VLEIAWKGIVGGLVTAPIVMAMLYVVRT